MDRLKIIALKIRRRPKKDCFFGRLIGLRLYDLYASPHTGLYRY